MNNYNDACNSSIAFIESNTTGTGRIFIEKARAMGFKTVFITKTPDKYPFLKEDLVHAVVLDTSSEEELYDYMLGIKNLVAIFSSSEYSIEMACKLAQRFNFPSNFPTAIRNCRNKETMAQILCTNNISCPKSILVRSIKEWRNVFDRLDFPVVVKPVEGTGSIGVKLCENEQDAGKHIEMLLNSLDGLGSVLIQEYIDGEEYSVETLGLSNEIKIIGFTKKHLGKLPHFLEIGHDFPIILPTDIQNSIKELISQSFRVLGLNFGPAHTEIRIWHNIPYIIEINPRLAGGMIPEMVKKAIGVNMIDATLQLLTKQAVNLNATGNSFASIRFVVPKLSGVIRSIDFDPLLIHNEDVDYKFTKMIGDKVILSGDFRDRMGYFIVKSNTLTGCQSFADQLVNSVNIEVDNHLHDVSAEKNSSTGRLHSTLLPEVLDIINVKEQNNNMVDELRLLAKIDESHILMLLKTNNMSPVQAKLLLQIIRQLKSNKFNEIKHNSVPRGIYLMYEDYLIKQSGIEVAGAVHTGRSRNDINATVFKLKLRDHYFHIYKQIWQLRSVLISKAQQGKKISIPIYSQYQTALPGTSAHYFLGVEAALSRDQAALQSIYTDLMISPLGACAGGGTSIDINQEMTAELLGFTGYASNSLDAVASRDLLLRFFSVLNICAMNLSRITEDLQLWSTNEFKFIDFPDTLAGGSSMMPQKKNPYLLEKIKGRLSSMLGGYVTSIMTMHKVPFGNSVEVSGESVKYLFQVCADFTSAVKLLIIILQHININTAATEKNQEEHLVVATHIVELLVKKGTYNLRQAHHVVGKIIRDAIDSGSATLNKIFEFAESMGIETHKLHPLYVAFQAEYGGGPGCKSISNQYDVAISKLEADALWGNAKQNDLTGADLKMETLINKILL